MDWIEEQMEKLQKKGKRLSLRKAMVLYLAIAILVAFAAVAITNKICGSFKNLILSSNNIDERYKDIGDGAFVIRKSASRNIVFRKDDIVTLPPGDTRLWQVLKYIEIFCIPVYSVAAICFVSIFFYRNKLQEPIYLLKKEMEAIRRNDLSFSCYYDSADEMGDICKSMDSMRKAVLYNQESIWELMEEQRKINGAFAHDIRTPLTVIIGYTQMLREYYHSGTIETAVLLDTLKSIEKQAVRMRDFTETMKEIQCFEMLEVFKKAHTASELYEEMKRLAEGLKAEYVPDILVTVSKTDEILYYDENIIMEVLSNLLSNAVRYGKKKVEVLAEYQKDWLYLYVKDDGRGMTREELYKADSPYYSDKNVKKEEDASAVGQDGGDKQEKHVGLGLTICKILCKKHGGCISFSNSIEGGAIVCAQFRVR